jgi:hypothetical protein
VEKYIARDIGQWLPGEKEARLAGISKGASRANCHYD